LRPSPWKRVSSCTSGDEIDKGFDELLEQEIIVDIITYAVDDEHGKLERRRPRCVMLFTSLFRKILSLCRTVIKHMRQRAQIKS
jgi:hypothetical protein